nr:dihydroorotate dehydrogenase [Rubrobacter indicoceani]
MVIQHNTRAGADTRVELCGLTLKNPIIPASGTMSKESLVEVGGVYGAILPKTTTPRARDGNPTPRIAETYGGMVNSIGLQNPGVEEFMAHLGDYDVGVPLFVSVAGDTVEEFREIVDRVAADERVSAIEMNLSCPNVEHGGLTFCAGPGSVEGVVAAARETTKKPLIVKLTFEGVVANAVAAEKAGADAVTAINTIPALTVDVNSRKKLVRGGLSGPAIKPVALRAVYEVAGAVDVPVVASGGVASGEDVVEFMLAGATAVQVGTASFVREPEKMLTEFAGYLQQVGLTAAQLTGELRSA